MPIITEGGLNPTRIEYAVEPSQGVAPTDPDWQIASDRYTAFEPGSLGPQAVEHAQLGEADPDVEDGMEAPELTVAYHMQQWFNDANGDPQDLAAYGLTRDAANNLPGSLTIVERMRSGDVGSGVTVQSESTVEHRYNGTSGATRREARVYSVAKGSLVSEVTGTANPEDEIWELENSLSVESFRSYQIDQPTSALELHVQSTDSGDTGLDVVVENDGATTTHTYTTDGTDATTTVTGTTTFASIDAIEVQDGSGDTADHDGDILIYEDDGAGAPGELLAVLYGRNSYGNTYGDPGIPLLGAGSHAAAIGTDFYNPGNLSIERPAGSPFEAVGDVQSAELSISNDITRTPLSESREQRMHAGMRTSEATLTVDGETTSHTSLLENMRGTEEDLVFGFDSNDAETFTYNDSRVSESPRSRTAGENFAEQSIVFIAGSSPALSISASS
jgi:hypothetical protein